MIQKIRKCDSICQQDFVFLNQRNQILEILKSGNEKNTNLKTDWTINL